MSATSARAGQTPKPAHPDDGKPWWKFAHVWLVFAGPAIVVVAGGIVRYESAYTFRIIFSVVKDNLVAATAFGFKQSIICQFE